MSILHNTYIDNHSSELSSTTFKKYNNKTNKDSYKVKFKILFIL